MTRLGLSRKEKAVWDIQTMTHSIDGIPMENPSSMTPDDYKNEILRLNTEAMGDRDEWDTHGKATFELVMNMAGEIEELQAAAAASARMAYALALRAMSQNFALVDRTEDYTPAFRAGRGFLELWSVDLNGRTIGVVRKLATSCWSADVYDGKFRNGFAKHRRLGDVDNKEGAFELVRSFYLERISLEGQLANAREIISSLTLWIDPAMKPRPGENAKDLLAEARAFMFPDAFGPDKYTAPYGSDIEPSEKA